MVTALLLSLALSAPPKKAEPAPAPESADVKQARELFQAGQKLYKEKKYQAAIAKFEAAYAVRPHPVIFFNVGKCYEQLGDIPRAMRAYRDYLRLAPDAKDRQQVSDAVAALEKRLREKGLQQLMVFVDPPSARVSVDGKDYGGSPASMELIAGNHTLTVSAEGFEPYERSFVMETSRATDMTIALRPVVVTPPVSDVPKAEPKTELSLSTPPPVPPVMVDTPVEKRPRVATWIVGGVAVASAGAGLGLGLAASANANELHTEQHDRARADQLANDAQGFATGANIAYGVAGAALVTAVVLFILEK